MGIFTWLFGKKAKLSNPAPSAEVPFTNKGPSASGPLCSFAGCTSGATWLMTGTTTQRDVMTPSNPPKHFCAPHKAEMESLLADIGRRIQWAQASAGPVVTSGPALRCNARGCASPAAWKLGTSSHYCEACKERLEPTFAITAPGDRWEPIRS